MKVKINNKEYEFQEELSILDAVKKSSYNNSNSLLF